MFRYDVSVVASQPREAAVWQRGLSSKVVAIYKDRKHDPICLEYHVCEAKTKMTGCNAN